MAVRKLAPPESQPASFAFTPESEAFAEREIAKYPPGRQASAIIALLGRAQEQCGGWLPQKAIEAVADRLGMAPIRAMEVATFYTMFNLEPVGRYFVQFCGTTPCALRGASGIKKVLERRIGAERHISADGLFSWLEVECLGACCNAPMVQINDDYYEDLTPENFEKLLDDLAAGRPVKPGSQIGRRSSEPEGAVNTLQDPTLFDGSVVGAWRSRFEEEALKVVTDEAAAIAASLPEESKAAKPPAGRAIESDAADTPAKRVKEGETPVRAPEQKRASSRSRATASKGKKTDEPVPPPQSGKSYVAKPSDPAAGRAVSESATTPVAGTPPSEGGKRDGSESKPDVPVDKNKTP
jgi:NADH-quinone oxidoreductase subunit E